MTFLTTFACAFRNVVLTTSSAVEKFPPGQTPLVKKYMAVCLVNRAREAVGSGTQAPSSLPCVIKVRMFEFEVSSIVTLVPTT